MKRFLSLLQAKNANWVDFIKQINPDGIHLDVMDGHAVPNLGLPLWIIQNLRELGLEIHVHLMVKPVELFTKMTIHAKPDLVFIHPKWCSDVYEVVREFHAADIKVGLVWDDDFDLNHEYASLSDTILCMTVTPGHAGQSFQEQRVNSIAELAKYKEVWVDGGVNLDSIKLIADINLAGMVIGSAAELVFK